MATIRTAIALYDGVTGPLKSMHKAMSIVLNSFEAMQRASGNVIDTASLQQAREELARADAALNNIEDSIRIGAAPLQPAHPGRGHRRRGPVG